MSRLGGLRAHVARWGAWPARALGAAFPRLRDAGRDAERLAAALLQPDPERRKPAPRALADPYFTPLPVRQEDLHDGNYLRYRPISCSLRTFYMNSPHPVDAGGRDAFCGCSTYSDCRPAYV